MVQADDEIRMWFRLRAARERERRLVALLTGTLVALVVETAVLVVLLISEL